MRTKRANRGFTLVEILIVVVILGILAAIVIPQFTQASTEAKISSLQSNLQSIRSQIELYKIQHNDEAPSNAGSFVIQMTETTDVAGFPGPDFGPYLQKMPLNPFSAVNPPVIGALPAGSDWVYENLGEGQYTFDVGVGTDSGMSSTDYVGVY